MCVKFYFCVSECFRLLEIWKSQLGRLCEFRETSNRNSKTFISIYFRIHGILLTDQNFVFDLNLSVVGGNYFEGNILNVCTKSITGKLTTAYQFYLYAN